LILEQFCRAKDGLCPERYTVIGHSLTILMTAFGRNASTSNFAVTAALRGKAVVARIS
jgi:hypothetical protein